MGYFKRAYMDVATVLRYNSSKCEKIKPTGKAVIERDNTCVCCGEIIPEGYQVCLQCMEGVRE